MHAMEIYPYTCMFYILYSILAFFDFSLSLCYCTHHKSYKVITSLRKDSTVLYSFNKYLKLVRQNVIKRACIVFASFHLSFTWFRRRIILEGLAQCPCWSSASRCPALALGWSWPRIIAITMQQTCTVKMVPNSSVISHIWCQIYFIIILYHLLKSWQ
jgi:hypothetical protein